MLNKIKNNKGFTLIELLAVIVILGILMIVAIPQVARFIEQSKKDTFIDTAKAYINAARYAYLNDEFTEGDCTLGDNVRIPINQLEVDNSGRSPFGGEIKGYITIVVEKPTQEESVDEQTSNNKASHYKYKYYATIKDDKKRWAVSVEEAKLSRKQVKQTNTEIENGELTCSDVTAPS